MYDAFRHNNGSGDNVRTVRTCESLPLGAVYCTCSLSPTPTGWFVVCMAYAQQIEEDMHASPTGGQAARYDSNEPSGIPHADPNHRAISCRLPEVHAVGKPLGRKPAWWISKIATNHFNYQPNHNSRVLYFDGQNFCIAGCRQRVLREKGKVIWRQRGFKRAHEIDL